LRCRLHCIWLAIPLVEHQRPQFATLMIHSCPAWVYKSKSNS
jgi:hypothetical protein